MVAELRLETGEILVLNDAESAQLYEALWSVAPHVRGAVTAAAKLRAALRCSTATRTSTFESRRQYAKPSS